MMDRFVEGPALQPCRAQVECSHTNPLPVRVEARTVPGAMEVRPVADADQLSRSAGEFLAPDRCARESRASVPAYVDEQLLERSVVLEIGRGTVAMTCDLPGADFAIHADVAIEAQVRTDDAAEQGVVGVIADASLAAQRQ